MIKRITNKQNINVVGTYVAQGQTEPKGSNDPYLSVGNNQETLIKFTGLNLSQFDRIGRAVLRLVVSQDPTIMENSDLKSTLHVQRNLSNFDPNTVTWNNKPQVHFAYDAGVLVPHALVAVGFMPETPEQFPMTIVELDLTDIFNYWKKNGITYHGITITKLGTPGVIYNFNTYQDRGLSEYFIIEDSKTVGLEPHLSHTPVDCGFAGRGFVNDLTGKLVFQLSEFRSTSNNAPISFTAYRSDKNLTGFGKTNLMGSIFRANFEYAIKRDNLFATLIHPNGSETIFTKMTKDEAKKYGIEVTVDEVYVDLTTYAYATYNGNAITINYQDKTKVELNLHKLSKITTPNGDTINYYWSGDLLSYITNSEADRVNFTYDTSNRIKAVEFVKEQRLIEISYSGNQVASYKLKKWVIDTSTSSGDHIYTELEAATYAQTSLNYTVVDTKNDDRIEFQITNDSVYTVTLKKHAANEVLNKIEFMQDSEKTTIEDFLGQKQLLYFDYYGQLTHRLDEYGKSIKVDYELVGKDGTARKVASKSNIQPNRNNLITDFSFDGNVGEYYTTTHGWKKNTNTNNIVKSVDGGVFGQKCLMVRKTGSGQTRISQVISVNPTTYRFIGFEKRQGISGNPVIKAIATYTILRLAQGSEVGIVDSSGNAWVSDTVTTEVKTGNLSGTTTQWQKFALDPIVIPTGATNSTITLEILASHTSGDLFVDDFQLVASEHAVNYNLIPNGYFEGSPGTRPLGWQTENLVSTDQIVDLGLEYPYYQFVGTRVMRFSSGFSTTKKLSRTFDIDGASGDEFVFSGWFRGRISANEDANVVVTVYHDADTTEKYTFKLNPNESGWQNLTKGFVTGNAYKQIKVSIEYRGFNVLLFDALQLYINDSETNYRYDDMGNVLDNTSAKASSESVRNTEGQVIISKNNQGETHRYQYDYKKRLIELKDNKGNQVNYTYDSKGNRIKTNISSTLGQIAQETAYNIRNQITKVKDEFGRETILTYDNEYRLSEVINPLGNIEKNEYNELNQLTKIIKQSSTGVNESLSYQYDPKRNLKKIIDGSSVYEFFYDAFENVERVELNQKIIVSYEYNDKHQMIKQTYGGVNGDYYDYTYDSKGRLSTAKFSDDINTLCTYGYDELDRVSQINYLGVTTYYSYDRGGKLIRKTDTNGQSEQFIYDNLDVLQKSIIDMNGVLRSHEYIMPYETSQYNFDGFIGRIDRAYNDDFLVLDEKHYGQTGVSPEFTYSVGEEDDPILKVPVIAFSTAGAQARYHIKDANSKRQVHTIDGTKFNYQTWQSKFRNKKTALGWFKFEQYRNGSNSLMSFDIKNYRRPIALVLTAQGQFRLSCGGVHVNVPLSTHQYQGNTWVFIALQIETEGNNVRTRLFINGTQVANPLFELKDNVTPSIKYQVKDIEKLVVGEYIDEEYISEGSTQPFKLAYLVVGAYDYNQAELTKIYQLAKPYFDGTVIRKQRSGVMYHDHDAYDGMDVVTLKGILVSEKGVHPVSYGYQAGTYKLNKNRLFEYDDERSTHVYGSYDDSKDLGTNKSKLVYDFNLKNEGFISLRFKPKHMGTVLRTILGFKNDNQSIPLRIYVNSLNQLVVSHTTTETLSSAYVNHNVWNHLAIGWNQTHLYIYLNGVKVAERTKNNTYAQSKIYLGSFIHDDVPVDHLNGQFEMLAHSDQLFDITKVTKIANSYQTVAVESVYDVLGRKEKDEITVGNIKKTAEYLYDIPEYGKASYQVKRLKTLANETIYYDYDALGNITKARTLEGTYEYEYDYMGRLIKEFNPTLGTAGEGQTIVITYNRQNIAYKRYYIGKTSNMIKQEEFLTNTNNQLLYVGTVEGANETPLDIVYDTNYLGNPTQIGNKNLTWDGRRLKEISSGSNVYKYKYNESGIRTQKDVNGTKTEYHLQGSNIVAETKNGIKTFFNYNEQGQLVGFEYDKQQYFYVRDLIGNIRNVIDKNGAVMVIYRYDAWGNHKVLNSNGTENTNPSFIGNINPFRYKGYYYDTETSWYYISDNFYNPFISRLLAFEKAHFIVPNVVESLNLSTYAINNPITHDLDIKKIMRFYGTVKTKSVNITSNSSSSSSNRAFIVGLYTSKNDSKSPIWLDINAFYIKGSAGLFSGVNDYSIASIEIGITSIRFNTPKWFGVSGDAIYNPNVYFGVDAVVANAKLGAGFSGKIKIIGGEAGIRLGDSVSIGVEAYVGWGITIDFSQGIRVGAAVGAGGEVYLEIDWVEFFEDLFNGRLWS